MKKPKDSRFVGFPPPLLGDRPIRTRIIADSRDWIALEKPCDVATRAHPWDADLPDLDYALNKQLAANKPELLRLEASLFGSVYALDSHASGVALFAKHREALSELRNQFGSGNFKFNFLFVAPSSGKPTESEFVCDAPLLPHNTKPKMIPSSAKGKKCETRFRLISSSASGWSLWAADAGFLRPHQIRAHAAVMGIPLMGDDLYGGVEVPLLGKILPNKRSHGFRLPMFDGFALHLSQLIVPPAIGMDSAHLKADLHRHLKLLLKRMELDVGS